MTEMTGIRTGVTNQNYHPRPRSRSASHPSTPGTLPYKRRILDRWTKRITTSGLPGHRRKTESEGLVNRLISKMKGPIPVNFTDTDYNKVVEYFEKAASLVEGCRPDSNGVTHKELIRRLPELIYDSMDECKKGYGVSQLGLAVSHLEEMMRRLLIIK